MEHETPAPPESPSLERAVVRGFIGVFSALALVYDLLGLLHASGEGGLVGGGRALSAVALGWMCGWYFTVRFEPTSALLRSSLMILAGHLVATVCAINSWLMLGLLDWLGASPERATFLSVSFVTFAPVAAFFTTQLSRDRAVHLVAGTGIGALSYVVLFGVPD